MIRAASGVGGGIAEFAPTRARCRVSLSQWCGGEKSRSEFTTGSGFLPQIEFKTVVTDWNAHEVCALDKSVIEKSLRFALDEGKSVRDFVFDGKGEDVLHNGKVGVSGEGAGVGSGVERGFQLEEGGNLEEGRGDVVSRIVEKTSSPSSLIFI